MVTDKVRLGATKSAAVVRQGLPEVRFEEGLKEVWRGGGHRSMEVGRGRNPGTQWRPVRLGCAKMWVLERSTGARESCPGVDLWEGAHPQPYRRSWKRNEASYQLSLPKEALKPFPEWRELGHWPTFNKTAVWCHPQFFSFWEDCFFISKKKPKKRESYFLPPSLWGLQASALSAPPQPQHKPRKVCTMYFSKGSCPIDPALLFICHALGMINLQDSRLLLRVQLVEIKKRANWTISKGSLLY